MISRRRFAAVDLGAQSGRVAIGRLQESRVELEVVHRFSNRPVWLNDGLHWDLLRLFADTLDGLAEASAAAPLDGIGVDTWGVDYALLDRSRRVLGTPFHYRDGRTEGMIARVHSKVDRDELYASTGIQTMPINTVFQLSSEAHAAPARVAEHLALIPDLFNLWLTGTLANEITIASTSGLLDATSGRWARELIARLGLPEAPFAGSDPVEPGLELGPVLSRHDLGRPDDRTRVWTVAAHDTASAFVATPLRTAAEAVLVSGTWSLLGIERDAPCLGAAAATANLTNERGVDRRIRLLRNVMGLWLLQQCQRAWEKAGAISEDQPLLALAEAAGPDVALFDPDADALLGPGDMPARITAACRSAGQRAPTGQGELVRSILVSLACKYRYVLEQLELVTGAPIEMVHVVGGGARNALLCQLTADVAGLSLLAGAVEASALGNVLVQARAVGELGSLAEMRELAAASSAPVRYEPRAGKGSNETYERFLAVTGLRAGEPEHAFADTRR
jgi:rhamnulokinase